MSASGAAAVSGSTDAAPSGRSRARLWRDILGLLREVWAAVPQARRRVAVYWLAVMARRSEAARSQKAATAEPLPGRGGEPWSR